MAALQQSGSSAADTATLSGLQLLQTGGAKTRVEARSAGALFAPYAVKGVYQALRMSESLSKTKLVRLYGSELPEAKLPHLHT